MTDTPTLKRREARQAAVRAQLLAAARPTDLLEVADHLTFLQLDPTAVVAPNADLVAWTRIGEAYRPEHLTEALEIEKTMFEHRSQDPENMPFVAMARPMSSLGLYLADMEKLNATPGVVRDWLDANTGFRQRVLDQLEESGPISSRDIPDTADVPWRSTGWTHGKNVTQILEFMASRGEVAVAGRVGKQRLWDLAERVYPQEVDVFPTDEAKRIRDERRLRALGIARPKFVGDAGRAVTVEGTEGLWRLDPGAAPDGFAGRTALLSPFDRLIHDHKRAEELFSFEFYIELYKPKPKRRWGYFVMPVLHDDQLVAKIDVAADRRASRLDIHAVHEDVPLTGSMRDAIHDEIRSLANWLDLEHVEMP